MAGAGYGHDSIAGWTTSATAAGLQIVTRSTETPNSIWTPWTATSKAHGRVVP